MRYFGGQYTKREIIRDAYFNSNPKAMAFLKNGFTDPFSGSGSVVQLFSEYAPVVAGDYANFAFYFTSLSLNGSSTLNEVINELNHEIISSDIALDHPFIQRYAIELPYFSIDNARRIVGYRDMILTQTQLKERNVLMGLLLARTLYFANTKLLFDGPLKTPLNEKWLTLPLFDDRSSNMINQVYHQDFEETIKMTEGGVLYLNPPSLQKDYRHYYHVLDTIITDRQGEIIDKSGRIRGFKEEYPVSVWSKISTAREAFYDVMLNNNAEYIVMTYNKNGILSLEDIELGFLRNGIARTFKKIDIGNEMLFAIEKEHNKWGF